MYFYSLIDDYYDGTDNSIILTSDKKYSSDEFEELVIKVSTPNEDDEDYIGEFEVRNIYQIANILVDDYEFKFVNCDACAYV